MSFIALPISNKFEFGADPDNYPDSRLYSANRKWAAYG